MTQGRSNIVFVSIKVLIGLLMVLSVFGWTKYLAQNTASTSEEGLHTFHVLILWGWIPLFFWLIFKLICWIAEFFAMERKHFRLVVRYICKTIFWLLYVGSICFGGVLIYQKTKFYRSLTNEWYKGLLDWIVLWGWIPTISWVILKPIHKAIEKRLCPRTQEIIIERLTTEIYDKLKPDEGDDSNFRVTLFKYRRFSWYMLMCCENPFGHWLCPYERSGYQRRVSKSRWKVNRTKPSDNEGVAGKCFAQEDAIYISGLPSTSEFKARGAREKKRLYTKKTFISKKILDEKMNDDPNYEWPRSFWGVRVLVNGKPWGVLLIDSLLEDVGDQGSIYAAVEDFIKVFGFVLETVEGK